MLGNSIELLLDLDSLSWEWDLTSELKFVGIIRWGIGSTDYPISMRIFKTCFSLYNIKKLYQVVSKCKKV